MLLLLSFIVVESMIGDVNLFLSDPNDSSLAEIEVMIADTRSRGKGYGHEACVMMMYYGKCQSSAVF